MVTDFDTFLQMRADHGLRMRQRAQRQVGHDDDPGMLVATEIALLRMPIEITIDYVDAEQRPSLRTIQVRRFNGYYLQAYCLLRKSQRTFVIERVRDAFDADGVQIPDLSAFLDIYYGDDSLLDEARARQKYWEHLALQVAPELLLMRLVAASDGLLAVPEQQLIADHAFALMSRREVPGERETVIRYVNRLSGTRETVAAAMDFVGRQSRARRRRFGEACLRLVEADGRIDDSEIDMLRILETSGLFGVV